MFSNMRLPLLDPCRVEKDGASPHECCAPQARPQASDVGVVRYPIVSALNGSGLAAVEFTSFPQSLPRKTFPSNGVWMKMHV